MNFTYHNRGDDVILDEPFSTAFQAPDEALVEKVNALAQENVVATGRACDVYAADGETIILRIRPVKKP